MPSEKHTIGLLTTSMSAYFVKRLEAGLSGVLKGSGLKLKVYEMHGKSDLDYHRFIESVADERDLGGLLYGHLRLNVNQVARFKSREIAVAAVGERMEGIDWSTVDEIKGAYLATRHLLAMGHRHLALLGGPLITVQARLREDGFMRALKEEGLKFGQGHDISILNFEEEEGKEAMNMLLDQAHPPTAVFVAAGDVAALGAMKAIRDRGLSCPGDVSVVGFDNLAFCDTVYPKLSSVNQPIEDMAAWAGRRLIARIQGSKGEASRSEGRLFEPDLVLRESVRSLAAAPQQV